MNQKVLTILFYIIILFICKVSQAQTYNIVNHISGTQNINGNNVTVTGTANTGYQSFCGAGNYWLGHPAQGGFTFVFEKPVDYINFKITGINDQEIVYFNINGVSYTLTAANLSLFPGTCNLVASTIGGGNLICPNAGFGSTSGGGEITISSKITSAEIYTNGVQYGVSAEVSFLYIHASSNSPVCADNDLQLFATPNIPGAQYFWTGPNNFSSTLQNPVIPNMGAIHEGLYKVTVTTSGGEITDTTLVSMKALAEQITYNEPACANKDLQLAALPNTPGMSYEWTGPAGFRSTESSPIIPQVKNYHSGLYTLTTTLDNCSHKTERRIVVQEPSYTPLEKVICSNEPFLFNNRILSSSGFYSDTLVNINGCDSIVTLDLVVLPAPEVEVTFRNESILCIGDTVLFVAHGADRYEWYHNDARQEGNQTEQYMELALKVNKITVVGIEKNECRDTSEIVIQTNACCEMFVPNAFSPNADGNNDVFAPRAYSHVGSFQIQIFNRWGQLVFVSYNINNQWDGIHNGMPADMGTYHYYITAQCLEGTEIKRRGSITLIR